jgi:prepilin-type N-terminal cleavage/methylation domain-containing protein
MLKQKKKKKNYRGFTFIEMMISLFIFSLAAVAFTTAFAGFIKAQARARFVQQNVESVRSAMEIMAKNIRTSTVRSDETDTDHITILNYSQSKCIRYDITGSNIFVKEENVAADATCATMESGSAGTSSLLSGEATLEDGQFSVTKTDPAGPTMGKVTITVKVSAGGANANADTVTVQTTVSLRDYKETKAL